MEGAVTPSSISRLHACTLALLYACPPPRPFIRLGKARGPLSKSDFRVFPALHWLHLAITIRALRRGGGNAKAPGGCYIRQEGISPLSCLFPAIARCEILTLGFPDCPDGILECLFSRFLCQNVAEIQGQRYRRRP
jgi:hypothetical protein